MHLKGVGQSYLFIHHIDKQISYMTPKITKRDSIATNLYRIPQNKTWLWVTTRELYGIQTYQSSKDIAFGRLIYCNYKLSYYVCYSSAFQLQNKRIFSRNKAVYEQDYFLKNKLEVIVTFMRSLISK